MVGVLRALLYHHQFTRSTNGLRPSPWSTSRPDRHWFNNEEFIMSHKVHWKGRPQVDSAAQRHEQESSFFPSFPGWPSSNVTSSRGIMSASRLIYMDMRAGHPAVHGVAKNQTWLSDWTNWLTESWTIKKAEHQRIDALELWCWRRLFRVPWTARRSNQSIIKEINPDYSLEGLIAEAPIIWSPNVKSQLVGTLMLGKTEGRRRRRQ